MERLASQQWQALQILLREIKPGNAFYRAKLGAADFVDWPDFFARCPFTTKQELIQDQREHPPYGTNLSYEQERYTRYHQTSGTSGSPLRWLDTPQSWAWMVNNWKKVFTEAGVTAADRILFAFSFGPFLGFWTAFEAGFQLGCLCLPGGGLSSLARLDMIRDNQVTALCCTPTYALRLGEEGAGRDSLQSVKTMIVAGEPGGAIPEVRQRIARFWPGARLVDHHGMTEVGPVSYGLPNRPEVLRIIETAYVAEIIDPLSGNAVAPGQNGELVLTTLGRLGSPLIRYRTGDLVHRNTAEPHQLSCYQLEGGILGRIDDMILVRGMNIYPSALESLVRRCDGIAEYRVHVKKNRNMTELEVEIEAVPNLAEVQALISQLESLLKGQFGIRIPVRLVPPGSLPRFEMKAKRWLQH